MKVYRVYPDTGILIGEYTENSPYIDTDWTMVNVQLPPNHGFVKPQFNFTLQKWQEGLTQAEIDEMNYQNALVSETEKYKIRQCDGVAAYAKISAEFRLAKLNGVITEEDHAVKEEVLTPVRNEILSGQWISAKKKLESIGSTIIGTELYDRLHLQISEYIALNY